MQCDIVVNHVHHAITSHVTSPTTFPTALRSTPLSMGQCQCLILILILLFLIDSKRVHPLVATHTH